MRTSPVVLSLALAFGSSGWTAAQTPVLRVGAAKVDVTPDENALPQSYEGILDRIHSRAIVIDDGTDHDTRHAAVDYEAALKSGSPERDFEPRSDDDLYVLYTGGTTGMPKGVVWRHEDVFRTLGGGIDFSTGERVPTDTTLAERAAAAPAPGVSFPIAPLMHGAAQWGTLGALFQGNTVVLIPKFDPHEVWKLVEQEKVLCTFNTLGTPTNTAIHKYMNAKKVPHLFVATGASKWGKPKEFPWTMGFQPDYHTEGAIYAKHVLANVKDAKIDAQPVVENGFRKIAEGKWVFFGGLHLGAVGGGKGLMAQHTRYETGD